MPKKITVSIGKPEAKEKQKKPAPEKRYGAFGKPDEDIQPLDTLRAVILDAASPFLQVGVNVSGHGLQRRLLTYDPMHWFFTDVDIDPDGPAAQDRDIWNKAMASVSLDPEAASVAKAGDPYRLTYECWPLSKENVAAMNLRLKAGSLTVRIGDSAFWQEKATAQERLAAAIEADEDPGVIADLELEVDEWEADFDTLKNNTVVSDQNFWYGGLNDWWRNYASINARQPGIGRRFRMETAPDELEQYEPFNPWDTDNFKVTLAGGTFASDEVAAPSVPRDEMVIGVVPVFWTWRLSWIQWNYGEVFSPPFLTYSAIAKRTAFWEFEGPGIPSPVFRLRDFGTALNTPSPVFNAYTTKLTALPPDFTRNPTETERFYDEDPVLTVPAPLASPYSSLPISRLSFFFELIRISTVDPTFSQPLPTTPAGVTWYSLDESNAELMITATTTPAESLVGKFRVRGIDYDVYRKTDLERDPDVLYEGPVDGTLRAYSFLPASGSGGGAVPWQNTIPTSALRDFDDYFSPAVTRLDLT